MSRLELDAERDDARSIWTADPPATWLLVVAIAGALVAIVGTFAILVYLLATGRP